MRSAAKQTLASAVSLLGSRAGQICLNADSSWNESLSLTVSRDVSSAGKGEPPVISGADTVTGWTAEGTANVWQKTGWTHDVPSGTERFIVIEDGKILTRVADVATCSSTPGSFVDVRGSSGSPITLKIHATGGGNPNTNGKTYEATKRWLGLESKANVAIDVQGPVECRVACTNNGPFYALGTARVSQVLATYGTKHNFFLANGYARDCISYLADIPTSDEGSNTIYVSYMNDPTGKSYTYERCGAIQPLGGGTALSGHTCFFAHSATAGVNYASGTIRQCWGMGAVYGGHAGGATSITEQGCYWRALGFISSSNFSHTTSQTMGYIYKTYDGATGSTNVFVGRTLTDCAYFFEKRISTDATACRISSGANTITRTALVMGGAGASNANCFESVATSGSLTVNNSIIAGFSGNLLNVPSGVAYTGDYNIFWTDNEFNPTVGFNGVYRGTSYTTLSGWQGATAQDKNSVYVLVADQAAGNAGALFLAWAKAAGGTNLNTIGPAIGDFRLNPSAKVYNGAGTALTGTFADNTPITKAGPQSYWDWNKRASVTGPPTAFPNVPKSLAECRKYISAPDAWTF